MISNDPSMTTMPTSMWRRILNKVFMTHDGKRDMGAVFGYPTEISVENYYEMYARGGISSRIIKAFPAATWSECPSVADENDETDAEFSVAFDDLADRTNLMHYLERADRLSGVGRFSILLLGFDDAKTTADFATPLREGATEFIYAVPYLETGVKIDKWVSDPKDPRFGQPELYSLTIRAPGDTSGTLPVTTGVLVVHHSRTLHIAEELEQDEVYGVPRLRPVFNHLLDLIKVSGGSAETYWMAANRGIYFGTAEDTNVDPAMVEEMKTQIDEYNHGQRRSIVGQGFDPTVLGSDVPDGSNNVDTLIKLISGTTGIPQRILLGNEAGELASSQDENNWNSKVHERRQMFAGPRVVRPFIEKMIQTQNLPQPQGAWTVSWEEADKLGEKEQADVALTKMNAFKAYMTTPAGDTVVAPEELRLMIGLEEESEYELNEPMDMGDGEIDPLTGLPVPPPGPGQLPKPSPKGEEAETGKGAPTKGAVPKAVAK